MPVDWVSMRSARRNHSPPPVEVSEPPVLVPNAVEYAGRFTDSAGGVVRLEPEGTGLSMIDGSRRFRLLRYGADTFLAPDSAWSPFPIHFGRQREKVVELSHGGRWFTTDDYSDPRRFSVAGDWAQFVGHYRAQVPYNSNFRLLL